MNKFIVATFTDETKKLSRAFDVAQEALQP